MPEHWPSLRLRRTVDVAWVFFGGVAGGLLRVGLAHAFGSPDHALPWVTLAENIAGAFLLGLFLGATATSAHRRLRLLVGTGALGSFTTYSTFVVELHALVGLGAFILAVAYWTSTIAGGLFAAFIGLRLGQRRCPSQSLPTIKG